MSDKHPIHRFEDQLGMEGFNLQKSVFNGLIILGVGDKVAFVTKAQAGAIAVMLEEWSRPDGR